MRFLLVLLLVLMVLLVQELEAFSGGVYRFDDFLHASRMQKWLIWQLILAHLFIYAGKIIWAIALPMAASNAFRMVRANWPLRKGNGFIRIFFLVVVVATLARFVYDVFN
jgi:hypothetical protein